MDSAEKHLHGWTRDAIIVWVFSFVVFRMLKEISCDWNGNTIKSIKKIDNKKQRMLYSVHNIRTIASAMQPIKSKMTTYFGCGQRAYISFSYRYCALHYVRILFINVVEYCLLFVCIAKMCLDFTLKSIWMVAVYPVASMC